MADPASTRHATATPAVLSLPVSAPIPPASQESAGNPPNVYPRSEQATLQGTLNNAGGQFTEDEVKDFSMAARNGDLGAVQAFVKRGMPVGQTWRSGPSALARAAKYAHLPVVKFLHKNGAADIDKKEALRTLAFTMNEGGNAELQARLKETATELLFSFRNPEAARDEMMAELRLIDASLAPHIGKLLRWDQ